MQYLVAHMFEGGDSSFPWLMGHSLLTDGDFARKTLDRYKSDFFPFLMDALVEAKRSGDLVPGIETAELEFWFAQHFALGIRLIGLPERPVPSYRARRTEVIDRAVRFALRGMGLKESAVTRYLRPWLGMGS